MAQARVSDYFPVTKRSQEKNPSKKRKINLTESNAQVSNKVLKQISKRSEVRKTKVKYSRIDSSSGIPFQKLEKNIDLIQNEFQFAESSCDTVITDNRKLERVITKSETADEVTSQWDQLGEPKTPKRKIRSDGSTSYQLQETSQGNNTRTYLKIRRADTDASTPNKREEENPDASTPKKGEEEKPSCQRNLALSFQGKRASSTEQMLNFVSNNIGKVVNREEKDLASAVSAKGEKPCPAYKRYKHLTKAGIPSLELPGKYQRLLSTFQGTDTVVSMLFNRQEMITFSKLQVAVQSMTRRSFEHRTLGQMKTVYPEAYNFRQEKGLPSFGNKVTSYQLTMEPNFEGLEKGTANKNDGKPNMSASVLLKRKHIFHNNLLDITKDHHADFLSKLNVPLQVQASKITRWHPRFPLDSVPDIPPAELPMPPVQVYQTAKQVLQSSRGKLPTRVEEAMVNVMKQSESSTVQPGKSDDHTKTPVSTSNNPKPTNSAYRGIPAALLEKIRAKEAAKIQASLTQDPKEEKRREMIGRLPNLIRSLRTFYVTEKKPSLPLSTVVEKLAVSYSTCISPAEVESHLTLLQELAPEWLLVIQIPRGKYIKINKNMDISKLIADITQSAKNQQASRNETV